MPRNSSLACTLSMLLCTPGLPQAAALDEPIQPVPLTLNQVPLLYS